MSADPHLITYFETTYWSVGTFPTKEEIISLFGYSPEEYSKQLAELVEPLKARGLPGESLLPPPPVKKKLPKNLLDPMFVLAVGQIVDTVDKRSTAAKLKALGLSTAKWTALLRIPENRDYFEKRLNGSFNGDVGNAAKLSLARNVEAGDLQSIKYYNEFTGKYRPDAGLGLNVGILIGRMMEILSSRLSPEVMTEIADEFEQAIEATSRAELSA